MFHKVPKWGVPRPFAKKPLDRMLFLSYGVDGYEDWSERWSLSTKLKYFYLNKTIRIRQRLINWWWKWKWRLGIHPAQKAK